MPGRPQKARIKAPGETSSNHTSRVGRTMTCKLPLMELTSWTLTNPCRRFLVCPNRYKTGVKKCKKFYLVDPELDNECYTGHFYGMYGQLHPHQIEDIATELTSHEQLIILQDDFVGLQAEVAQTQKNASFWKSAFMTLLTLVFIVYLIK
nr:hypothetical protein [Tanacetum cinerariifolium]